MPNKKLLLICILLVLVSGCDFYDMVSGKDLEELEEKIDNLKIQRQESGEQWNNLIEEKHKAEQIFMDTLPERINCIHNPTCEGKKEKSFVGGDCRFNYYFWEELKEDMERRGEICNFESGELLWQPKGKEETNFWCNEYGECEIINDFPREPKDET